MRWLTLALAASLAACTGAIEFPHQQLPPGVDPEKVPPGVDPFNPDPEPQKPACVPGVEIDPGRPTLRRLNRFEYNNTIADLLGDTTQPANGFPNDDFGNGFDNNGDVLSTAPILVEKWDAAATKLIEAVLTAEGGAAGTTRRVEAETMTGTAGAATATGWNLSSNGTLSTTISVATAGQVTFSARAYQQAAGTEAAKMNFRIDGTVIGTAVNVTALQAAPATYQVMSNVSAGNHVFAVEFTNDFYEAPADRNLVVDWIEVKTAGGGSGGANKKVVTCDLNSGDACLRTIITDFGRKAWRRPLTTAEVDNLFKLVTLAKTEGDTARQGLSLALQAVLLSPHFVYRVELDADPASTTKHRLTDHELATRLSYFFWGTTPDAELNSLADQGMLTAQLEPQIRRMLMHEKADAIVTHFAGSWLGSRTVEEAVPSHEMFPTVDAALKTAMRQETELYFKAILTEDRSALDLMQSDFTFVNDALATHYGFPLPGSAQMQRVTVTGNQRGGVLGHAGLLTVTSDPTRTSPVKRGKWVLAQLMCEEPPPPPPGVEGLAPPANPNASLRERMEAHRTQPVCASCHSLMDPIGFGMENYDAVGHWRENEASGFPVDSSGTLPDGRSFNGPQQLSTTLKTDERFAECIAEKLLIYGVGRSATQADKCSLHNTVETFHSKNDRLVEMIVALTTSETFTHRRGETP